MVPYMTITFGVSVSFRWPGGRVRYVALDAFGLFDTWLRGVAS